MSLNRPCQRRWDINLESLLRVPQAPNVRLIFMNDFLNRHHPKFEWFSATNVSPIDWRVVSGSTCLTTRMVRHIRQFCGIKSPLSSLIFCHKLCQSCFRPFFPDLLMCPEKELTFNATLFIYLLIYFLARQTSIPTSHRLYSISCGSIPL